MEDIELHWNILREEGRVLKAASDLARLKCKLVPKDYTSEQLPSTQHLKTIIFSIETLKEL
jgi:hypothetical protein